MKFTNFKQFKNSNNGIVTEGAFEETRPDVKRSLKRLKKAHKKFKKLEPKWQTQEDLAMEFGEALERVFDEEVAETVVDSLMYPKLHLDINRMQSLADHIMRKYGTHENAILEAIDMLLSLLRQKGIIK